jgi:hypothetical protein
MNSFLQDVWVEAGSAAKGKAHLLDICEGLCHVLLAVPCVKMHMRIFGTHSLSVNKLYNNVGKKSTFGT